jgi:hypothetical protein
MDLFCAGQPTLLVWDATAKDPEAGIFSPPESTREIEEYQVDFPNVTLLELVIKPNYQWRARSRVAQESPFVLTVLNLAARVRLPNSRP